VNHVPVGDQQIMAGGADRLGQAAPSADVGVVRGEVGVLGAGGGVRSLGSAVRSAIEPCRVRPERLRPPEVLLPGQIPAQLARCPGCGTRSSRRGPIAVIGVGGARRPWAAEATSCSARLDLADSQGVERRAASRRERPASERAANGTSGRRARRANRSPSARPVGPLGERVAACTRRRPHRACPGTRSPGQTASPSVPFHVIGVVGGGEEVARSRSW
jgi:hypothetical protein